MTSVSSLIPAGKLATFRISPHSTEISSSMANGSSNSPAAVKKDENDGSIVNNNKISSSNANNSKPAPDVKLSSFGMAPLFSRVEITLENTLLPEEKLSTPPSLQDGLDMDTERDLRYLGSELIQKASILLKLPQVAAATGQILYQRFYCAKSFVRYDFEITAIACTTLASKIEEAPRRIRDVMNVFHHMRQTIQVRESGTNTKIQPLLLNKDYIRVKNEVIKAERRVLKELGFCVHVKHPHKLIYAYLQALKSLDKKELIQRAWNYMNDSLRTDIFLRCMPETIACACIFLAARDLSVPLPEEPPWWEAFDADRDMIDSICRILIHLYSRQRPSWRQLELRWNEAKKRLFEKQAGSKAAIESTPTQNLVGTGADKGSPLTGSTHPSRQGSPRAGKYGDRDRDRDGRGSPRYRRRPAMKGSPRRGRSRSRSRSRSPRSRSPRDLPKRYSDYRRRDARSIPQSYDSKNKNQRSSKKYEALKYVDRRKRT